MKLSDFEPVAWDIQVDEKQTCYLVDDIEEAMDDLTNHSAIATPLFTSIQMQRAIDQSNALTRIAFESQNAAIDLSKQLTAARANNDELLNMLWKALPFVEDHEGGDAYKPETVKKTVEQIKRVLNAAESHGQPEKQPETETTKPAIVFYPAGSLGEDVATVATAFGLDPTTLESANGTAA